MTNDDRPLIFLGVDIGKSAHYAVAVDRDGQTVYSTPVANEESALRLLVLWAQARQAAVIVDQPGGTAAMLFWRAHASLPAENVLTAAWGLHPLLKRGVSP